MSRLILCASMLALIAAGCNNDDQCSQSCAFVEESKPKVSVVPIIDNTDHQHNWSLSDELSSAIYNQIAERGNIALNKVSEVRSKIGRMNPNQNLFGPDLSWAKNVFKEDQFVVFLELVKHEEIAARDRKDPEEEQERSAHLNMSLRIRVLDLRGEEPKIVLQQLAENSYYVPRPFNQFNIFQPSWGDESFSVSPLGIAHASLTKEVSRRIEDYILRTF